MVCKPVRPSHNTYSDQAWMRTYTEKRKSGPTFLVRLRQIDRCPTIMTGMIVTLMIGALRPG